MVPRRWKCETSLTCECVLPPATRHFRLMSVYPSGMLITPVQMGAQMHSHVKVISHFHLRGIISPSLLQRIKVNRMLEACCYNYLHEFRNFALAAGAPPSTPPTFVV